MHEAKQMLQYILQYIHYNNTQENHDDQQQLSIMSMYNSEDCKSKEERKQF